MSETYKGNYAPELFDENKRYYLLNAQQQANLTDAELRELHNISNTFLRRFIQTEIGNNIAIDTGFNIAQSSSTINNFTIIGGDGTNPGVFYLNGYRLFLNGSIDYTSQNNIGLLTRDGYTETALSALTIPSGTVNNLNDIALSSSMVICGADIIMDSTNWGRSWIPEYTPTVTFEGVSFGDASNVFAVGSSGHLATSTDGGQNWTDGPTGYGDLNDTDFINSSVGWIVGDGGIIAKTVNGGSTWTPQGSFTSDLYAITAADATHLWVVGADGTIGAGNGTSWVFQTSPTTSNLNDVFVVNSTVFAVGDGGTIIRTVDGTNWSVLGSDTTENLNGVFFADPSVGWAVGDNGVITRSTNGGGIWDATTIVSGISFKGVVFQDTTGFAVGSNGSIYRTLDGSSWEPYRTDYVYIDFHLAEVSADGSSEYYDASLFDSLVGPPDANRLRIVSDVKVSEGWPAPTNYLSDGTVQHLIASIAKIQRTADSSNILQANITDLRTVVRTISELDQFLKNGGIDSTAIADGAVTPSKLDITGDYTVGSLHVLGGATVDEDLSLGGNITSDGTGTNIFNGGLQINGSSSFGDISIDGSISQVYDGTFSAYDLQVTSSAAPALHIYSTAPGEIIHIERDNTSTQNPMFDMTSNGFGYEFEISHTGNSGGIFKAQDDATGDSFSITKTASSGSVVSIVSDSAGPTIKIVNDSIGASTSIEIDQAGPGTAVLINTADATGVKINSIGSSTDLSINHVGLQGQAVDVTSSGDTALKITNLSGRAVQITQYANEDGVTIIKDGTGLGRALDVYNYGSAEGLAVGNLGSGIAAIISHVGDGTNPAVDIFVAGLETGPALRINKSNDEGGEVIKLWNQGYGESITIAHDRTDSTANVITIDNKATSTKDISSNNWWIDNTGNMFTRGDVTTNLVAFDQTHYVTADAVWFDYTGFDSSNPGIAGQLFRDSGFIRMSDGTNSLPPPFFGTTGMQGATGLQGPTGFQGQTGIQGIGFTGLQGITGVAGSTGADGRDLGGIVLFLNDATYSSDITGYKLWSIDPIIYAEQINSVNITSVHGKRNFNDSTYVTETDFPSRHILPSGNWQTILYASIDSTSGSSFIISDLYTRTNLGVETKIADCTNLISSLTFQENIQIWATAQISLNITDRLVVKVYALTTSPPGSPVTISYSTGDTTAWSHFHSPIPDKGTQGITGIQGLTGSQGQTGLQGVTGVGFPGVTGIGATGLQGPTGSQGLTGAIGQTGPQGQTGFKGETGVRGVTGTQGATGTQGSTGILGETGLQGSTGFQGETGLQGLTGIQGLGETGLQGMTGFQGVVGSQGQTGPQGLGETGLQGMTGFQGATGLQGVGATGFQGATGSQGETGIQGQTGPQGSGETGLQGPTGSQGLGATGIQGETGIQGATGLQGETGLQGIIGVQGVTGSQGETGLQGVMGDQGTTGSQGETGVQGVQGDTGIQGATGAYNMIRADGGFANSTYLAIQHIDGGGA